MEGGTAMTAIITAMTDVFSMVGTVVTAITGQPVLLFILAASLIPIGLSLFRKLRGTAKGN